jgi:hypothetical protein
MLGRGTSKCGGSPVILQARSRNCVFAFMLRAMNTAKDRIVFFDPMADDFGSITRQVVLRLEAPHDHVQFGSAKG